MRFQDALAENLPPDSVGDVRFWYEPGQLWAEQLRGPLRPHLSDGLYLVAVVCALLSFLLLVLAPSALLTALTLGAAAAGSAFLATRSQRRRGRHRFVLDFTTETFTLERYARGGGPARRLSFHFDDVAGVDALQLGNGDWSLTVRYHRGGVEHEEVLVPRVPDRQAEGLQRIWRMLHNAFGLRPVEGEVGAGDTSDSSSRGGDSPESTADDDAPIDQFDPGRR